MSDQKPRTLPPAWKRWVAFALALALVVAGAVWAMIYFGRQKDDAELVKLGYETIKLSIQLILVVLVGGFVVQNYTRANARKSALHEFRRDVLSSLSRAYSDVKSARRVLRANCRPAPARGRATAPPAALAPTDGLAVVAYDKQMGTINAAQLELEIMARELEIIKESFLHRKKLIGYIKQMEKYLGKIISEYEKIMRQHGGGERVPLSELPLLYACFAKGEQSDFSEFVVNYRMALLIIQQERVKIL